jgi:formate hydrogenlyase subunit 6/NADH:ubiquinone oxidoreductase subunit I
MKAMNDIRLLRRDSLQALFEAFAAGGRRIIAPVRHGERVTFEQVKSADSVAADYIQTSVSAKEALFPRYETLLQYRQNGKAAQIDAQVPTAPPTVLFGVHPCDAASIATLRAVLTWGSPDAHFESKLAATTIVGLACTQADPSCFCTSVGGGPQSAAGSDVLLTPLESGDFRAEVLTEKGRGLVALGAKYFEAAGGELRTAAPPDVAPRFDHAQVKNRLAALFDRTDVWIDQSLGCLGCGACAYVCPTCSCFDIQDERDRRGGLRLRCWDSCGFAQFTLHASGHNPRSKQSERWRQRVMHKFSYQPQRLGVLGCVGCGRCSRSCPADMNLGEHVQRLAEVGA